MRVLQKIATLGLNIRSNGLGKTWYAGVPQFVSGDRVVITDEDLRKFIGDDTAIITEISSQFARWEYHIYADDPTDPLDLHEKYGKWVTADEIDQQR